jgi:hypothetical protein
MHQGQHGGAANLSSMGQPLLSPQEAVLARTEAINQQFAQIAGMKDQAGGRRGRRGRKPRKTHRRSRKMRGGAMSLSPADVAWLEAVKVPQGVNPQFASWNAAA